MTSCVLPHALRARLVEWARAARPHEACGLLVGRGAPARREDARAASITVDEVALLPNRAAPRYDDRFEIDALDLLEVDHRARQRGLEVVGVWHSHPRAPAVPSRSDRVVAAGGWPQVIVGCEVRGHASVRAWRLVEDDFVEVALCALAVDITGGACRVADDADR